MKTLKGAKGGGSSTPTQANDSLQSITYAQVMDLISMGPIYGPPSGDPQRDSYLNDVPIKNADGTYNYNVDAYAFRYGDVDQTYIPGFDTSTNETSVGVELKKVTPWSVVVTDVTKNAIVITLGVQSLSQTDPNNGNVDGYTVAYQVQMSVDGGAYSIVVDSAFNGKCSGAYSRSHRIPLSGATSQYSLRVVRITDDTTSVYIQDTTTVVSYSLVVDAKLRYPLSAIAALSVDAVQFSSVPTRSYDMKGLLVKVPSNYNPNLRTYTGVWDGSFVTAWTDNPAWIFYDLVLNPIYGLGQVVDASMLDRYSLYQIAQYCDVMVSDGKGGLEPRFTCNCYIQARTDAYKVLQDLASVFRGMAYWSAGSVVATADMPGDPVYLYTAANVIGGQFKYVGSSLKTRYTCAVVQWNNPDNAYKPEPEYVEDRDGISRYGINRAQITAFGCTSRAQAQRVGQWSILTSRYETNLVTFSVGLDGTLCQPGQIIAIADPSRASQRRGGRIRSASDTAHVTLDKIDPNMAVGDTLRVVLPQGGTYESSISGISGSTVTLNPPLSSVPVAGSIWISESTQVNAQLFRVTSVAEKEGITFEITASQHEPGKYAAIDNGAQIDVKPITGNSFTTQVPPSGITLTQYVVVDQGIAKTNMTVSWVPAPNAVAYTAQFQKDSGTWVDAGTTGSTSIDVHNIYTGSYLARVKATNAMGVSSVYAVSTTTNLTGKDTPPPVVASLNATSDKVFAIQINWAFPPGAGDTAYTEIYYSHTNDFNTSTQLGRFSYPSTVTSLIGLVGGYDMYFWARLVDTSGNVGPWYPSSSGAGVHGMSSSDATAILQYLTGKITSTQLGQDLLTPIQAIPGIQANVASNSAAISQEVTNRNTAIANEAAARGAAITTEQNARQAADDSLGQRIDTVTASAASNAAAIQAEQTARANGDSANASSITALTATVGTKTTTFRQNIQPVAQAVGDTWVDTGSTNLLKYSGTFSDVSWTKVQGSITAGTGTAPDGTAFSKFVEDTTNTQHYLTRVDIAVTAGLTYTVSAYVKAGERRYFCLGFRTGANWAGTQPSATFDLTLGTVSLQGTQAVAKIVACGGGVYRCSVTATATASFSSGPFLQLLAAGGTLGTAYAGDGASGLYMTDAQVEQSSGAGRYITTTTASVSTVGNNNLLVWDGTTWVLSQDAAIPANTAAINSEATTRANAVSALSSRIDQVSAQVVIPEMAGDPGSFAGDTTVYAGVWSETTARAEADIALSQKVDTVTAQITSASSTLLAAVSTETQARIDADSATASVITTVQAQVNSNTAAVQTNAASYADLNGRVSASYQIKTQITANGRTYIAGIGVGVDNTSGTVESQVLVSASRFAVLDPNGAAVSSPFVIQGGQVFMNSAFIGTGYITNAMIGGVIQSTSVGANGQPRWSLDKNGVLTMNGANAGSGYLTINDSTVTVFDGNGTLRVRMGIW